MDAREYRPPEQKVPRPPIIAHRGAWTGAVRENTLAAFSAARDQGAWGIEFDVRFTADDEPIISHDDHLRRVFGIDARVSRTPLAELRRQAPEIPRLEETLAITGVHFMIEIKRPLTAAQTKRLSGCLGRLDPVTDYHLLTLRPEIVNSAFPASAWILVGETRLGHLVRRAARDGLAGVAGHYAFLRGGHLSELHDHGLGAGVGFTPTANLYRREWARGVDWVFVDSLAALRAVSE